LNGFIADVRIVKGTAVYTSAFTPPTAPLSAITNTEMLLQSSPNVYDASGTSTITLINQTKSSTAQTKYASSSIYFDGSGDRITIPWHDGFNFGSGDFTIEMWYNLSDVEGLISWGSSASDRFDITATSNNLIRVLYNHPSYTNFDNRNGSDALPNVWQHFACVRHGDTLTYYIDGVLQATQAFTAGALMPVDTANGITIGARRYATTITDSSQGYFEDVRITKGLARYPFTPSQETLTADSNTFLLACAADTVSVTGDWTVTNGGSAPTVSNFAPFPGMKSLRFTDATTRLLLQHTGTSADYNIGDIDNDAAANWSIEAWVYNLDTSFGNDYWFGNYSAADANNTFMLGVRTDGDFQLRRHTASSGNQIAGVAELGKWQHHLFTQEYDSSANNTKARLFVDGRSVYDGTQTNTSPYDFRDISIGGRTDTSGPWNGYISNLRIQTGTVANPEAAFSKFTPPTSELLG
jgi:hypothetical protein